MVVHVLDQIAPPQACNCRERAGATSRVAWTCGQVREEERVRGNYHRGSEDGGSSGGARRSARQLREHGAPGGREADREIADGGRVDSHEAHSEQREELVHEPGYVQHDAEGGEDEHETKVAGGGARRRWWDVSGRRAARAFSLSSGEKKE